MRPPEPIPAQEEVSALKSLGGPHSDAAVEMRALQRIKACCRIEGQVANPAVRVAHEGLKHGGRAPDALPEVGFDAVLPIPHFQACGDDSWYHDHRTVNAQTLPGHADPNPLALPQDLAHGGDLPGAEEFLDAKVLVRQ
eukprot:CAMPEP_0179151608 /NCGR_PEP_ID=MMETSP0796-20121207/73618_1 /TAXON_ID=73915 /ORGANISM="Pyrodinium bahamense, Strain pbaha01" /LENGTH=138 /DNA_ID=CAMNT_0020852725 /DNA_START=383 /DNA_END=798 /DNA_ORIENTATION=+